MHSLPKRLAVGVPLGQSVLPAFLQTVLLASLAGVGAAATDPLVQSVVGRIASDAIAAEALVLNAAAAIDAAHGAIESGDDGADALIDAAELRTIALQGVVVEIVLRAATTLFEVGGASATDRDRSLDRHWRNARTLSSHNPVVFQQRVIGDHLVNGSPLTYFWATGETG